MTARRFFRDILPILCWLCVIFFLSTDNGSAEHTNSFLDRYLRLWFAPLLSRWSASQLDLFHYCVRKAAHITEYLILAVLILRATLRAPRGVGMARAMLVAWALATAYAMTDEFHQRFVSSRTPKVTDVMIDSCGALLGVCLVFGVALWRRQTRGRGGAPRGQTTEAA